MFAETHDNQAETQVEPVRWADARCRDGDASMINLFFSEQLDDIARAKAICASCPLVQPCLDGALVRGEPWGVWGGQLFANGRVLAFKRKRGRPPKNAPRPPETVLYPRGVAPGVSA